MATLQQVLGAKNLIGRIQAIKPGLAADLLPPELMASGRTVEGNYGTYRKVIGERRVARVAMYGAPSQVREMKGISEIPVTLMHTIESINFPPALLQNLTNYEDENKQTNATLEIARQTADFHDLFENLRVASVSSLLAYGRLDFNPGGELLLPTVAASGALTAPTGGLYAVDMGIPSGNRNQLNVYGTNLISATWATTTTSIITQLNNLKIAARKQTGYPIKHAFYGNNVLGYIQNNTELKDYMKRNEAMQEAMKRNEIPAGFLGLDWHPMRESFYATNTVPQTSAGLDNSSPVSIWPANLVTFTPDFSPEWYELIQGTYPVDATIDEGESAESIAEKIINATGMFAYAYLTRDPMGIKEVAGDTFLPLIKVPAAVYQATVAGF
jgi:hypothetical protein